MAEFEYSEIKNFIDNLALTSKEDRKAFCTMAGQPVSDLPLCVAFLKAIEKKMETVLGSWYFQLRKFCHNGENTITFTKYKPRWSNNQCITEIFFEGNALTMMSSNGQKIEATRETLTSGAGVEILVEAAKILKRLNTDDAGRIGENLRIFSMLIDIEAGIREEALYYLHAQLCEYGEYNEHNSNWWVGFRGYKRPLNKGREVFRISTDEGGNMSVFYFVKGGKPQRKSINDVMTRVLLYVSYIIKKTVEEGNTEEAAQAAPKEAIDQSESYTSPDEMECACECVPQDETAGVEG